MDFLTTDPSTDVSCGCVLELNEEGLYKTKHDSDFGASRPQKKERSGRFDKPFIDPRLEPTPLPPRPTTFASSERGNGLTGLLESALESLEADENLSRDDSILAYLPPFMSGHKRARFSQTFLLAKIQKGERSDYEEDEMKSRFHPSQDKIWEQQRQKLLDYKRQHGYIPISFPDDPVLARWVKRQRYQYKRYEDGNKSTMNARRIEVLESAGFVWDAHSAVWQRKLSELAAFKQKHGHSNVPSCDPTHKSLATWVKCQRRHYKLLEAGGKSSMTSDRINKLEALGFVWTVRSVSKRNDEEDDRGMDKI